MLCIQTIWKGIAWWGIIRNVRAVGFSMVLVYRRGMGRQSRIIFLVFIYDVTFLGVLGCYLDVCVCVFVCEELKVENVVQCNVMWR